MTEIGKKIKKKIKKKYKKYKPYVHINFIKNGERGCLFLNGVEVKGNKFSLNIFIVDKELYDYAVKIGKSND